LRIVFFTFYYPPDLSAGSFRSVALANELSKKLNDGDELHIITTQPNRYASHIKEAKAIEVDGKVTIHRLVVPRHKSKMSSQARSFSVYFISAYMLSKKLNPDFLIGTTSRLMTGILTGFSSNRFNCKYFIDVRDIFSETISDLFSRKNKILGMVSKFVFSFLEIRLFNGAAGVNVVSEGFPDYYRKQGINVSNWTFFPNGVDKEFQKLQLNIQHKTKKINRTVLYVGNIGSGQALESILPDVAKKLNSYRFLVIGDGGMRAKLKRCIIDNEIQNIEILPPVKRSELIRYYQEADILFLHLNDIPAFKRVLPSKIFEYTVFGKPIIAGISGYPADFVKDKVPHAIVFEPRNANQCIASIRKVKFLPVKTDHINIFIEEYARERIMKKMAAHILSIL
jgi:glycosyltransferase involved in cell wall biosynthesis